MSSVGRGVGVGFAGRAAAVVLGVLADRLVGEPPSAVHPVALFGRAMGAMESVVHRDSRRVGAGYTAVGVGLGSFVGSMAPLAVTAWATTAGTMLRSTAWEIEAHLARDDIDAARRALPSLVGRDPSELDASEISAAVIESVAENSVDAMVAPLLWALVAGGAGAGGYRAANTLDAMVGHHSDRYERFGWASARLDDLANWAPARVFVLMVVLCRPTAAGAILSAVRRDGPRHPSPNAGRAEAAFAGALGIELGGPLRYGDRLENRPRLGDGHRPKTSDIGRAIDLARDVERLLTLSCAAALLWTTRGFARAIVPISPRISNR